MSFNMFVLYLKAGNIFASKVIRYRTLRFNDYMKSPKTSFKLF